MLSQKIWNGWEGSLLCILIKVGPLVPLRDSYYVIEDEYLQVTGKVWTVPRLSSILLSSTYGYNGARTKSCKKEKRKISSSRWLRSCVATTLSSNSI